MSAYTIEVSVTLLCSCCGKELPQPTTESKPTGHPLEWDNPFERKDRRVFVTVCGDCFAHVDTVTARVRELESKLAALVEALKEAKWHSDRRIVFDDSMGNMDAALKAAGEGLP